MLASLVGYVRFCEGVRVVVVCLYGRKMKPPFLKRAGPAEGIRCGPLSLIWANRAFWSRCRLLLWFALKCLSSLRGAALNVWGFVRGLVFALASRGICEEVPHRIETRFTCITAIAVMCTSFSADPRIRFVSRGRHGT